MDRNRLQRGPPTTSPEVVVRTQLQRKLGGFRQELTHWGDVEMLMRFAAHSSVGYIKACQAYYRVHENNMHSHYLGIKDLEQRSTTFRFFFDTYEHHIKCGKQLRSLAFRRVAEKAIGEANHSFKRKQIDHCKALLEFAQQTHPEIVSWKPYSRIRWKLAMGPTVWAILLPVCA